MYADYFLSCSDVQSCPVLSGVLGLQQQSIVSGNPAIAFVQEEHVMKIIKLLTKLALPCYAAIVRVIDVPGFPDCPRVVVVDIVKICNFLGRARTTKAGASATCGASGSRRSHALARTTFWIEATRTRGAPALTIPERLTGILI